MMTPRQAFAAYGQETCREAHDLHADGQPVPQIAKELELTVRQVEVAVRAWRDYITPGQPTIKAH